MNLSDYQKYYILDEGHWYVSKIKQYDERSINLMAKQLNCIVKLFSINPDKEVIEKFKNFYGSSYQNDKIVQITDKSKLFISIYLLDQGLIGSDHLSTVNPEKFKQFNDIQKEFLNDKDYDFFTKKYGSNYLKEELSIYYRNAVSWLSKNGFYGEYPNKSAYITEVGLEFSNNSDSTEKTTALFTYQLKKYQHWNPTLPKQYSEYKIRPFYLLLQLIDLLPDNFFTKDEYILFISKLKSHDLTEINKQIDLIKQFRALSNEEKIEYINQINLIDKKKYPKKKRTNFDKIKDSAAKEIPLFTMGNIIGKGDGEYQNCYVIKDKKKLKENLSEFNDSFKFIEFNIKLDWVKYHGEMQNVSLEEIIEMYIRDGKSQEYILKNLPSKADIDKVIFDKLYERDIEEYYFKNIEKLDSNLEILVQPTSGRQYQTHIGPIDLLCKDKTTNEYVVVELKRGNTNDEIIGQVLRYMGWVYINLEKSNRRVRGLLVAKEFSENIDYSIMGMQSNYSVDLIRTIKHDFTDNNRPLLSS